MATSETMVAAASAVAAVAVAYLLLTHRKKTKKVSEVVKGVGKGGQDVVTLKHASGAICEVYLHGATVTRYATGGREVLWVSKSAVFDGKKAIRGGIPLVYPQFGPKADARLGVSAMKQHGFARVSKWELRQTGDCSATFVLRASDATRQTWGWPHDFELRYDVTLAATSLRTALTIKNLSDEPVAPQALLHTYYATPAVADTSVDGLGAHTFLDQLTASTRVQRDDVPITFSGELDRIYDGGALNAPKTLAVSSEKGTSPVASVLVEASLRGEPFAPDVVVWNPHVAKAKAMGDFDDDGWKEMLCVEPGILNERTRPSLPKNATMVLAQTITPPL